MGLWDAWLRTLQRFCSFHQDEYLTLSEDRRYQTPWQAHTRLSNCSTFAYTWAQNQQQTPSLFHLEASFARWGGHASQRGPDRIRPLPSGCSRWCLAAQRFYTSWGFSKWTTTAPAGWEAAWRCWWCHSFAQNLSLGCPRRAYYTCRRCSWLPIHPWSQPLAVLIATPSRYQKCQWTF